MGFAMSGCSFEVDESSAGGEPRGTFGEVGRSCVAEEEAGVAAIVPFTPDLRLAGSESKTCFKLCMAEC